MQDQRRTALQKKNMFKAIIQTLLVESNVPSTDVMLRHQINLNFLLSLVLAVFAALEPLIEAHEFPVHAALFAGALAIGFIVNMGLLKRGRFQLSGYLLSLLIGAFVLEQIFHHTGISWAFILPPVVLFLNPFRRGIVLLGTITLGILLVLSLERVQVDLRDQEPIEFIISFFLVCIISGFLVWDLSRIMRMMAVAAFRDQLTGLYRRGVFFELGAHALRTAERHGSALALVVMDLDNFKAVNDRLGHGTGDEVLTGAAAAMVQSLRGSDILARFGGDEFVALLPGTGKQDARLVVNRLQHLVTLAPALAALPQECRVTVSAGIADYPADGRSIEKLFEMADTALLQAKQAGKNRTRLSGEAITVS